MLSANAGHLALCLEIFFQDWHTYVAHGVLTLEFSSFSCCRGSHLGFTQMLPNERHNSYRQQILDSVCVSLAGRAAEEVLLGDVTDGAISDLHHASEILMDMVTKLGFGSSIGLFSPGDNYKFSTSAGESHSELCVVGMC